MDGLYYLAKYLLAYEMNVGTIINDDFADYYGELFPVLLGPFIKHRGNINMVAYNFRDLPEFKIQKKLILVEGESERIFVNRMMDSGIMPVYGIEVLNYQGKTNGKFSKIHQLVEQYRKIGYEVKIQGDQDGKGNDIFSLHKGRGLFNEVDTFAFKYDFESSLPIILLLEAMEKINIELVDNPLEVVSLYKKSEMSINRFLKEEYNLDLKGFKVLLSDTIGKEIARDLSYTYFITDRKEEIFRFIEFLRE
ncbi:TOPRIM nucleotidyl transferase/hydrolase domain-containing protein [Lewinella sp. IMCC34191]|uniref:TOPRIM nucleotidyl transferase/hydrolase domain-containing protein n=1 Tax=Lewinella sp. IMCC34191 TaxID=2259172 RepID=UPI000E23CBBE|nr:TOPRIM nucleotidyl transferase/hydrolase domain-containing protein [Lewinella sp. IMCC34191]